MSNQYPTVSSDPSVQARYESMRESGESHRLAEVLALRAFPATRTDTEFNRGRVNGNQFEHVPGLGDYYKKVAEEAGVSTTGKFYCNGLASYPGDPTAWVDGRGDVLRVAKEKGMRVTGLVEYEPPDFNVPPQTPDLTVDPVLIRDEVEAELELDPGQRREDVEERVMSLRAGRVDDNDLVLCDHNPDDHLIDFS